MCLHACLDGMTTLCTLPAIPTPNWSRSSLFPVVGHTSMAHNAAMRNHTSPTAMGRTPPSVPAFLRATSRHMISSGMCARLPATMWFISCDVSSNAALLPAQAALTCSYVQPEGPATEPFIRRFNTLVSAVAVICTGTVSETSTFWRWRLRM